MSFPSSLPSYNGFTSSHTLSQDQHASQHNAEQADLIAIATKVGTGSSTPTNNTVLRGNGSGTSAYGQIQLGTDVSGVLPVASGGTGTNSSTGSGSVVLNNSPSLQTPTITGGGSWAGAPTITDFTNANHNHQNAVGGGTLNAANALQANTIVGSLIKNYSTSRDNNGSNTTENAALIQTGWAATQPGAASTATMTVTFPVAYTNVPIVVAVYGGDTAGVTSSLGSGGINVKQAYADASNLSTTGCTLTAATRDSTNWSANNTVYVQWIAIGF